MAGVPAADSEDDEDVGDAEEPDVEDVVAEGAGLAPSEAAEPFWQAVISRPAPTAVAAARARRERRFVMVVLSSGRC